MIHTILTYPNKILTQKSEKISIFNSSLRELRESLIQTCELHNGAGLAAIQIGIPIRAQVVFHENGLLFMANPVIDELIGPPVPMLEGCLSFPGVFEKVKRATEVLASYDDVHGHRHQIKATGLTAHAIQHETDHLDGMLIPDRLDKIARRKFNEAYKKQKLSKR